MEYIVLTLLTLAIISVIVYAAKRKRTYASLKEGKSLRGADAPDLSAAGLKKVKKALPNPAFMQTALEEAVARLEGLMPGEFELGLKWLADNKNRLFSEAEQICAQQANLSMKLPVNKTGNLRIYEAAGAFVLNNGGSFSQDDLIDYVRELNQSRELQLEEGFLLPFCLKLCLLEHITQSALSMLKAAEIMKEWRGWLRKDGMRRFLRNCPRIKRGKAFIILCWLCPLWSSQTNWLYYAKTL